MSISYVYLRPLSLLYYGYRVRFLSIYLSKWALVAVVGRVAMKASIVCITDNAKPGARHGISEVPRTLPSDPSIRQYIPRFKTCFITYV